MQSVGSRITKTVRLPSRDQGRLAGTGAHHCLKIERAEASVSAETLIRVATPGRQC